MLKYALIPLLPFAGFLIAGLFGKYLKERAAYVAVGGVAGAFLFSVSAFLDVLHGTVINENLYSWIAVGNLSVNVGFQIDQLTAVMLLVVTTLSSLIHIYSVGYMHGDKGYARFFAYLELFTFFMLVLVMANNFLLLFVGWEGVGLCSYLLIGFWYEKKSASDAGVKAFVVNRIGDFGFILGMMFIFVTFGSLDFAEVFKAVATEAANHSYLVLGVEVSVITLIALLLFVGATGKSAQLPLYVWLPDAMEGPTPVSALIHAATMVTAGVYMVARSAPLFNQAPAALLLVGVVGALTAVFAATIALVQNDIKRVVAYSTISQLGYMFLGAGVGAYASAIFHLATHAFFKALLFLGSGSVIHGLSGEQDIRKMGAVRRHMPVTAWTFLIAALANAGIFPLAGFWSKDEILYGAIAGGHVAVWVLGAGGAFLTAFYMLRCYYVVFEGRSRVDAHAAHHLHESPLVMTAPLVILAAFSAGVGFIGYPPEHGAYHRFVEPVFAAAKETAAHAALVGELPMMIVSLAIALAGVVLALRFYHWRPETPARMVERYPKAYRVLLHKYFVDEAYEALFVEPIRSGSVWLWRKFDDLVIDGSVNGVAAVVRVGSLVLRRVQTGYVMNYVLSFIVGVVAILGYLAFWR